MFHLPGRFTNVAIFNTPSTVTNLEWATWTQPRGVSMAHIICIAGGAGGGGGFSAVTDRGGGGGGGSAGITSVTIPLYYLPKQLFIQVGAGGAGGAAGAAGANGVFSFVGVAPDSTASNVIAHSGNARPLGGAAGTAVGSAAGGAAGTIALIAQMPLAGPGQFALIAGQAGSAGGLATGAAGADVAIPVTSTYCMGGTGGGGAGVATQFAGGGVTSIASSLLSESRPSASIAPSGAGSGGFPMSGLPLWNWGGLGGASVIAGTGGNGGPGSFGAGGGGGGAGTTGGRGGDGGSGLVVILCW